MCRKNDLLRWLGLLCIFASLFLMLVPFLNFDGDGLLDPSVAKDFLLFAILGICVPLSLLIKLLSIWLATPRLFLELIVPPPISR
ncbi:MAG: hypothetical protein M1282_07220 [Chloroflexi bacterium]|nr:hypothetical protein [Chloroflexota bacterium]